MIILDTSFLIDFFKGEEGTQAIIRADVATTAIRLTAEFPKEEKCYSV